MWEGIHLVWVGWSGVKHHHTSSTPPHTHTQANTTSTWFRNIARGQVPIVADANKCTLITSCNVAPTPICPYVKLCGGGKVQQRLESAGACSYSACA